MKNRCGLLTIKAIAMAMLLLSVIPVTAIAQGSGYNFNDEVRILYTQAASLLNNNQPGQALPLLEKASTLAPYSFEVNEALGIAYQNTDNPQKAVMAYQKAITINPQMTVLLIDIAHCYRNMKQPEMALQYYDEYLKQNNSSEKRQQALAERQETYARLLYSQGTSLLEDGKKNAEATKMLEEAEALEPSQAGVHFSLGMAYSQCGNLEKAIPEFQTAYKLNSKLADAIYNIGVCYQDLGRINDAIAWYQQFLQMNPTSEKAKNVNDIIVSLSATKQSTGSINAPDYFDAITSAGDLQRWIEQSLPIRVYIASGYDVPGYQNSYRNDLIDALNAWVIASGNRLGYVIVSRPEEANVVCDWTADPAQVTEGGNTAAGGSTKINSLKNLTTGSIRIQSAFIRILTQSIAGEMRLTEDDIKIACLHETGHMFGLDGHSNNNHDVMFHSVSPSISPALTDRDKATILRLYESYPRQLISQN